MRTSFGWTMISCAQSCLNPITFSAKNDHQLSLLRSDKVAFSFLSYARVQMGVRSCMCSSLLFRNRDTKCYGPSQSACGMLSPILSLLVPLDALQAGGDAMGDFTMCHTSIIWPSQPLRTAVRSCFIIIKTNLLIAFWICKWSKVFFEQRICSKPDIL